MGDRTTAIALQIAKQNLDRIGRRYNVKDIAEEARKILEILAESEKAIERVQHLENALKAISNSVDHHQGDSHEIVEWMVNHARWALEKEL